MRDDVIKEFQLVIAGHAEYLSNPKLSQPVQQIITDRVAGLGRGIHRRIVKSAGSGPGWRATLPADLGSLVFLGAWFSPGSWSFGLRRFGALILGEQSHRDLRGRSGCGDMPTVRVRSIGGGTALDRLTIGVFLLGDGHAARCGGRDAAQRVDTAVQAAEHLLQDGVAAAEEQNLVESVQHFAVDVALGFKSSTAEASSSTSLWDARSTNRRTASGSNSARTS